MASEQEALARQQASAAISRAIVDLRQAQSLLAPLVPLSERVKEIDYMLDELIDDARVASSRIGRLR